MIDALVILSVLLLVPAVKFGWSYPIPQWEGKEDLLLLVCTAGLLCLWIVFAVGKRFRVNPPPSPAKNNDGAVTINHRRIDHFCAWLRDKVQGYVPEVDEQVVAEVTLWLHDRGCDDPIRLPDVCRALRKLVLRKHYDSAPAIWHRITGGTVPALTLDQERTCLEMFSEIQAPFSRWMQTNHACKSFFPYRYLLYKFSQVQRWDALEEYYAPDDNPRREPKLRMWDEMWKYMCLHTGRQYIPSIPDEK